jgi:hypothetical protein
VAQVLGLTKSLAMRPRKKGSSGHPSAAERADALKIAELKDESASYSPSRRTTPRIGNCRKALMQSTLRGELKTHIMMTHLQSIYADHTGAVIEQLHPNPLAARTERSAPVVEVG